MRKILNKFLRIAFGIFIITTGFSGIPNKIWAYNLLSLQTNQNHSYFISTEQSSNIVQTGLDWNFYAILATSIVIGGILLFAISQVIKSRKQM
jgi:hypothetical protein